MNNSFKTGLVWLRRDLRVTDHPALFKALTECQKVYIAFIFDQAQLGRLIKEMDFFEQAHEDRRLGFIYESLQEVNRELHSHEGQLIIRYGEQVQVIHQLIQDYSIHKLYFHRDYEPRAKERDLKVVNQCKEINVEVEHFKDHVIFEHQAIRTAQGDLYKVFTPYKNRWLEAFWPNQHELLQNFTPAHFHSLAKKDDHLAKEISLDQKDRLEKMCKLKFLPPTLPGGTAANIIKLKSFTDSQLDTYDKTRDFPALESTSLLSTALRHGVISIREAFRSALSRKSSGASIWMSELIWREFYQMILDTHPSVVRTSFRPQYDAIQWRGGDQEFQAWCQGQTGYPLVDGAMRGLNQTGQIHNRLRMVVGSFLCKTLLVNWRLGERYFALKLLDYDLAANNGGWQWCSSSGCDAQPYFRIFNPYNQSEKFDAEGEFIRLWCPELRELPKKFLHRPDLLNPLEQAQYGVSLGQDYPAPIVDYKKKRQEALEMYQVIKS